MWLANQNALTIPVSDLSFFALGAIIIGIGFAVQLRVPERKIAGVQQAVLGLLALGVAGLIGNRIEPLVGSLSFLVAAAILAALHPARREFFKLGQGLALHWLRCQFSLLFPQSVTPSACLSWRATLVRRAS